MYLLEMSFGCLTDRRDIPEGIVMAAELPPGEAGDLDIRWPAFAAPPISTDSKSLSFNQSSI